MGNDLGANSTACNREPVGTDTSKEPSAGQDRVDDGIRIRSVQFDVIVAKHDACIVGSCGVWRHKIHGSRKVAVKVDVSTVLATARANWQKTNEHFVVSRRLDERQQNPSWIGGNFLRIIVQRETA